MTIKKASLLLLLDSFIIFLNISNSYSIIPYLLFFQYYRAINTGLIAIINTAFLYYRFNGSVLFTLKDSLFNLFFIINILNYIFGLITNTFGIGMFPFIFANSTFYIILYNLYRHYSEIYSFKKSAWYIIRGYIWFVAIGISSILSLYILISFFNFNPLINDIGDKMDLFYYNNRDPNNAYYFPNNLSVLFATKSIRIPFFQEYGVITGIFHEPHTLTFLIIPSIFIIFGLIKKIATRIILIGIYVLISLIAASTMSILSVLFCIVIFIFIKYHKQLIIPTSIIIVSLILFLFIDKSVYSFIIDKINSRSADYSIATIRFAFTPKTIIGTSFFDLSYLDTYWNNADKSMNVGFITFILNLLFLILFIFKVLKVNLSNNLETRFIGLFLLYFLLHSMKITMYTYSLSYLIFAIFLTKIYSDKNNSSNDSDNRKMAKV